MTSRFASRIRVAALLTAFMAALTGCAGIPDAGPVRQGAPILLVPSTGLIAGSGSVRPKTARMRIASSSAGVPSTSTVRWPTGFMNAMESPSRVNPSRNPRAVVVLPRFWPVAAR